MIKAKQGVGATISAFVERPAIIKPQNAIIRSIYDVEHWRKGELLSKTRDSNLVTNEGLDRLLDEMFGAEAKITPWYVLIFNTNTTILATHTYAVPGFTESSDYDEGIRQEYTDVPSSSQSITNSVAKAIFTISASTTIYGAGLVGATAGNITTIGDTAATNGTEYCAALFGAAKVYVDDDVLNVTIVLTAADA